MSDIVLHGFWRSSSAHRMRIALALKGIEHTRRPVHLGKRAQRSEAFLARHPTGRTAGTGRGPSLSFRFAPDRIGDTLGRRRPGWETGSDP